MVNIHMDIDIPKECHECPLQLKFKDGEVDDWYNRRCVIEQRTIEYPRPDWCPISKGLGMWKKLYKNDPTSHSYECERCGISQTVNEYKGKPQFKFCPYCGAYMLNSYGGPKDE